MARSAYPLLSLLLTVSLTSAQVYQIWENAAYTSANSCAKSCAAYVYGYQAVALGCGGYPADPKCLCNANGQSSTVNSAMSNCPFAKPCGGEAEATQAMAVFSAYCNANLGRAGTTATGSTARASTATAQASTGATATNPQATPNQTQASSSDSNNSSDSSNENKGLSQSDKIAIGCAIGGAIVAIILGVPGFIALRRRRRGETHDSQPLHNMPQTGYVQYQNPAQQPFLQQHPQPYPQPYQQNGWGWRG